MLPGCCGDSRCNGCAWECTSADGHDDLWDEELEVFVCGHCERESPRLLFSTKKAGDW